MEKRKVALIRMKKFSKKKTGLQIAKNYKPISEAEECEIWAPSTAHKFKNKMEKTKKEEDRVVKKESKREKFIEASKLIGKKPNYFITISIYSPKKMRFILLHGKGDLIVGHRMWEEYEYEIRSRKNEYLRKISDRGLTKKMKLTFTRYSLKPLSMDKLLRAKKIIKKIENYLVENEIEIGIE